tara:strand:+ start:205 stop:378 length:174 start_codon:yes stop_codon:yes gene_type:complete
MINIIFFNINFVGEFGEFLKIRNKYWLVQMIIALVIFGASIILGQGSAVASFIYTIF